VIILHKLTIIDHKLFISKKLFFKIIEIRKKLKINSTDLIGKRNKFLLIFTPHYILLIIQLSITKYQVHFPIYSIFISYNVLAVCDVFLRPIKKKMRSIFTGAKKCGGEKQHKGCTTHSPTGVLCSLAAIGGVQLQSCYMQCLIYYYRTIHFPVPFFLTLK
jgi:hypothetical protein